MPRVTAIAALLTLAAPLAGPAHAAGDARTLAVDPVELVGGRAVPGVETIAIEHAGYRYVFASDDNRAVFAAEPARYEIQLGGACARMGPLSGVGTTELYAVHDGRIYIFASEACRRTFLDRPEKLLEKDDPAPQPLDAAAAERGRALLARAVEAMGGADAIDSITTCAERVAWESDYEGEPVARSRSLTVTFPEGVRRERSRGEETWVDVTTGAKGWFESSDGTRDMHAQQRRALERIASRNLLVILRARHDADFVALATGPGFAAGQEVEGLVVAFGGSTCTLGLDPATGRVVSQRYLGRGPAMEIGEVERSFSDFRTVERVTFPHTVATRFEGEPLADSPVTLTELRLERE